MNEEDLKALAKEVVRCSYFTIEEGHPSSRLELAQGYLTQKVRAENLTLKAERDALKEEVGAARQAVHVFASRLVASAKECEALKAQLEGTWTRCLCCHEMGPHCSDGCRCCEVEP